jgi:phosphoribosylformylglycinamidine synthase PurS subunit
VSLNGTQVETGILGRANARRESINTGELPVARVVVDVMLKPEILDPQGQAVANALPRLGVEGVESVRIGKRIEITFAGDPDLDQAREIADRLLANPVIEDFDVRIEGGDE